MNEENLQPGSGDTNDSALPVESANDTSVSDASGSQTAFQRVSEEEAVTLPYAELRRRMEAERDLVDKGLLTPEQSGDSDEAPDTSANAELEGEDDKSPTAGRQQGRQPQAQQNNGGQSGDGNPASAVLEQATRRVRELEQQNQQLAKAQQDAELQRRHNEIQAEIAQLPREQQAVAQAHYRNQLGQLVNMDAFREIEQRQQAVAAAELNIAKRQLPSMLSEVAAEVASKHGIPTDFLAEYVNSPQTLNLINAATNEQGIMLAASTVGEMLDFMAGREAGKRAAAREARRQQRAKAPAQRDTPIGGVPLAGGELDEVTRIQNMSTKDFFEWKKQQLRLNDN